ncbi:MAG: AarF/ABC1/UbiB kinase family protein [Cyanobacteriota bacterium]
MVYIDYSKISEYLDEDFIPSILYDPDISLQALKPKSFKDIFVNPYYLKALLRLLKVFSVFLKILIDYWYDKQKWTYFKQWILTASIEHAESIRRTKRARWLRDKILELGPTFIKIGQALSTRSDLLRREYVNELSKLQDKVPAFSLEIVEQTIVNELGKHPDELFDKFYTTPLAAASLGQVHRAKLITGEEVVVKIQRPDLIEIFNLDIAILKKVARFCRKYMAFARDRNWPEIVDEFGKTLFEEIDYVLEAKNADLFAKNLSDLDFVYIPKTFKNLTTRKILTLEYKPGIKIDDIESFDDEGIDKIRLSHNLLEVYLKQFLNDGIYHADPHPGNLAVEWKSEKIIFYDFGMVGRIDPQTKLKMLSAFINMVNRNADELLKDLVSLKMIDRKTADFEKIKSVIQWCFDNYYDTPYEEVRFEEITDELADIMYAFPFRLPASFTYIVRALVTLEGLSIRLNPRINFMEIAVPYVRKYLSKSEIYEMFKWTYTRQLYKRLVDKLYTVFGIELNGRAKSLNNLNIRIDREDMELLRKQMINGFGVIGLGLIIAFSFIALSIVVTLLNNIIASVIFIIIVLCTLPAYFVIMLAVLLNKPTRPKDLLRKHLEQKNKFNDYH